jgi:hypothetical protein
MAREEPEVPYVDYTSIRFPSDRLTLGRLRQLYPDLFDPQGPPQLPDDELTAAMKRDLHSRGIPLGNEADTFLALLRPLPDEYSIERLRREYPDQFDVEGGTERFKVLYEGTSAVLDVLWNERVLARMAYQEALGQPADLLLGVHPKDRPSYIEDIIKSYIHFGLAKGDQEARVLVQDFTAQAMAQAPPAAGRHEQRGR